MQKKETLSKLVDKAIQKRLGEIANHSSVSEKEIEKYLSKRIAQLGGICLKYSNSNMVGYPDRIALLPGKKVLWFELKSKGKKPTKIQKLRHEELGKLGHTVFVCSSKDSVDNALSEYGSL